MMRHLILAGVAGTALMVLSGTASAGPITCAVGEICIAAQSQGFNGGNATTLGSPLVIASGASNTLVSVPTASKNVGSFGVTASGQVLADGTFDTNVSLSLASNAHTRTLNLWVTETGVSGPGGEAAIASLFQQLALAPPRTATGNGTIVESVFYNSDDAAFGMETPIGQVTWVGCKTTGPVAQQCAKVNGSTNHSGAAYLASGSTATLTGPGDAQWDSPSNIGMSTDFSLTVEYSWTGVINQVGTATGEVSTNISYVPEPTSAAMFGTALMALLMMGSTVVRRRS